MSNTTTFTFNNDEIEVLQRGLEMVNDFENDTMFEHVNALFPETDKPTVLNVAAAKEVRGDIDAALTRMLIRHRLLRTFGGDVSDKGYSR